MATKKFIIEVEEGMTKCDSSCPFKRYDDICADHYGYIEKVIPGLRCEEYNLATLKIRAYEETKI